MARVMEERVWAGSETSLRATLEAEEKVNAQIMAGSLVDDEDDDEEERPRLLTVEGGVAVVTIKGSLVNSDDWYNQYIGATGYPEIREALVAAAEDQNVSHILLDIDSGGGAVSGCEDTAKLIRMINDQVKPVSTFSDGVMASAAYWLGSSAGKVFAGRTALVGSVGILCTHVERSKMLEEAGVGVNVIRAGKYKALANSVEPLSEEGRKQLQAIVDASYQVFLEHVAAMRGKSVTYVDDYMAQGREFVGQAAADVGLVDSITSFDEVLTKLRAEAIDRSQEFMDTRKGNSRMLSGEGASILRGETGMTKKTLTAQQIAAIAAGAHVGASAEAPEAKPDAQGAAPETQAELETTGTSEPEAKAAEAEQQAQIPDVSAQTIKYLEAQLATKDQELINAKVALATLEQKQADLQIDKLKAIAGQAVDNMRIALGGSALNTAAMSVAQIVADHEALSAQFAKLYPVGGVAAVSGDAPTEKTQVDPRHLARVKAVRFHK